ncbi:MAG: PASTA domain-containing protein [Bacteroidales bacterium]|nr:PASTA domain-containing protein [Bacteroidales bacterium]MBQ9172223.1 PASTA domain-containing protein [Bacteroidales bacterium]MBQ9711903.1 PASTA domain-containing protein [Bacteroidales bacterium]MBR1435814.1 PASTA domain-containing protein [Bacteroidales bacterium]MBR6415828.1 PASTA domain-containing protein [Bacteroidales bacterium]
MEKNENTKAPKKEVKDEVPFLTWLAKNMVAAIVAVLLLVLGANMLLKLGTRHGKEITVPDFTNMTVKEAKKAAGHAGVRIDVVDSVYVRRMARGVVYRQNPSPGSNVKNGRRILLTINSVTPKKVQMPNLVGLSMRQAKAELLSRGINLGKLIYVNDIATNNVLRQLYKGRDIKPGTMIESGSDINLEVGLNTEDNRTYVPDFKGMKYMRAVDAVHDNSLNVAKLIFDSDIKTYGDTLDAVVYKQAPSASRAPIVMGSDVTLYLSKDPKTKE